MTNIQMSEVRELTMDETDLASGANPILAFFVGYVATKVLDEGPSSLLISTHIKKIMDDNKGKEQK
jgi:hypothetical protein